MHKPTTTAKARYTALHSVRQPFLKRAENAAALTIPSLLPPEGTSGWSELPQPFQSVGARGVNHLAAKILLALFPPGSSFFRLKLDEKIINELVSKTGEGEAGDDAKAKFEAALSKIEMSVLSKLETAGARATLYDTIRHLLVPGNVLLQVLDGGRLRNHYMNTYVINRDGEGTVLEIVIKETLDRDSLPEAVKVIVDAKPDTDTEGDSDATGSKPIDLYTRVYLDGDDYEAYQEVMDTEVPDTRGSYPKDKTPWIPLRFTRIEGESWGRSMVDEYSGDLQSLESLAQSLVEIAQIAANVKVLVDPNGVTKQKDIARRENGAVLRGTAKDVTVLSIDKLSDFTIAKQVMDSIERRLGEAFLLGSAVRRDAERVTAEEVRVIAAELEQSLGGFYSILGQELQLPLVARYLHDMSKNGELPALPKKGILPSIVTGLEALGRGGDLAKLDSFIVGLGQVFGPEAVTEYINVGAYALRRGTALGLEIKGLVRGEEEVQAAKQQRVAQQMTEKLGPQLLKNSAEQGAEPTAEEA